MAVRSGKRVEAANKQTQYNPATVVHSPLSAIFMHAKQNIRESRQKNHTDYNAI